MSEDERQDLVFETVATCIVGMLDTFTTSEAGWILKMVQDELKTEQGEGEEGGDRMSEKKEPRWAELVRDVILIGGAVLVGERLIWLLAQ